MTLRKTLEAARASGKSAFIPFLMAGDPDLETCGKIIRALEQAGADAIELGIPFTDPVADGETVQRAAERALKSGTTLPAVLELVKALRDGGVKIPICLFSYLNPVFSMGYDAFAKAAKAAGADGALIVDLPPEEAEEYAAAMKTHALETVFLCSPTTDDARLKAIDAASTGFVYYVAREGVTGARGDLPPSVAERLAKLKTLLKNPVAVGFGISTPDHVRALGGKADGIVVGSALVKVIAENPAHAPESAAMAARQLTGK